MIQFKYHSLTALDQSQLFKSLLAIYRGTLVAEYSCPDWVMASLMQARDRFSAYFGTSVHPASIEVFHLPTPQYLSAWLDGDKIKLVVPQDTDQLAIFAVHEFSHVWQQQLEAEELDPVAEYVYHRHVDYVGRQEKKPAPPLAEQRHKNRVAYPFCEWERAGDLYLEEGVLCNTEIVAHSTVSLLYPELTTLHYMRDPDAVKFIDQWCQQL